MTRADDDPDPGNSTVRKWKSLTRRRRSSDIVSFARTKGLSAWSSVKIKLMGQPSSRDIWRRSPPWPPEDSTAQAMVFRPQEARWPDDAEESLFCESLLGLMQRCGRFDYLSGPVEADVEEKEKEKEEEKEKEKEEKSAKERRRSFLRQLRANRHSSSTI